MNRGAVATLRSRGIAIKGNRNETMSLPPFLADVIRGAYPDVLLDSHEDSRAAIHSAVARAEVAIRCAETEGPWSLLAWGEWAQHDWPDIQCGGDEEDLVTGPPHWEAGLNYVREVVGGCCEAVSRVYRTSGGLLGLDHTLEMIARATATYVHEEKVRRYDVFGRGNRQSFVDAFVIVRMRSSIAYLVADVWRGLLQPRDDAQCEEQESCGAEDVDPAAGHLQRLGPDSEASCAVTAAERRAAVDAYIAEVYKETGRCITRTDIWKSARYKSRTEFERWERNDGARPNKTAHEQFTRVLREKPHIK
jgi:hypothetical protein